MKLKIQSNAIVLALSLIACGVFTLTLNGCASMGPNETTGTVIGGVSGAALGGAIGQNALGAGVGAVAGGVIGSAVGRQADNNSYNDY